ncbi:Hypothetical_protein [Hexamita inflata]|uniref:Hypothetical_protein n=1 Tax=Hexamita inflata TaxID=28002 RepID=A0AA86R3N9_9EUKA|nr:Hypothetical protein HINF_LOCUS52899 [Hexamita inflata]
MEHESVERKVQSSVSNQHQTYNNFLHTLYLLLWEKSIKKIIYLVNELHLVLSQPLRSQVKTFFPRFRANYPLTHLTTPFSSRYKLVFCDAVIVIELTSNQFWSWKLDSVSSPVSRLMRICQFSQLKHSMEFEPN